MTAARNDLVTTQVIGEFLQTTAEEMAFTCYRTAYSPNMKERWDVCAAVFDGEGQVVSLASYVPIHLGSLSGAMQALLKTWPVEAMRPGDVFVANDPYVAGGSHLPDIVLTAPVFADRRVISYVSVIGHHADIGGKVEGSSSATARSIFEEGLRLPAIKIQEAGVLNQAIVDIIKLNSRTPNERDGDLRAQLSALKIGLRNVMQLVENYGSETVEVAMAQLMDYSESRFRAALASLRPGEYTFTDYLDDDGLGGEPVPVVATAVIHQDRLEIRFDGTTTQLPSGFNVPLWTTRATVYYALKAFIDPGLPPNAGYYRAVEITAPEGSLVNPKSPAAVSLRANTCQVVADAVFGALSQAHANGGYAGCGPQLGIQLGGVSPTSGEFFVHNENVAGGWGARWNRDGLDASQVHITNTANIPIETAEHEFPIEYLRYELLADSGGTGRFRGGFGVRRDLRILSDEARITLRANRHIVPAKGARGGSDGKVGRVVINPDGEEAWTLPWTASGMLLKKGDVMSIRTAGGGGFGALGDEVAGAPDGPA